MKWEKLGITIVSAPVTHGSGFYIRIPKKVVDAYDLFATEVLEVVIRRVGRQESEDDAKQK